MKKMLLLGLLSPLLAFGQYRLDDSSQALPKGSISIGFNIGVFDVKDPRVVLAPHLQYFLANNWSLVLEGRHWKQINIYQYSGLQLASRYYFLRAQQFAVYGQVGYRYGRSKIGNDIQEMITSTGGSQIPSTWFGVGNIGLGLQQRIGHRWAIQGLVDGNIVIHKIRSNLGSWQGNIGVLFFIK